MKKIIKRIVTGTLIGAFTFISGIITLILFPQPLFAKKIEYKNFRVYTNTEINPAIKAILDSAEARVAVSELNDLTYKYDIFLSYNSRYNRFDNTIFGKGPAARTINNNLVIKVNIDPVRDIAFITYYKSCESNLTHLIAHEMVHCLHANTYGILKFNPAHHPVMWKLEGYPEYISKQMYRMSEHELMYEIDKYERLKNLSKDGWITTADGCAVPEVYYKSGLMIKYLMDIEHYSYDKILNNTASENVVYDKIIKWKTQQK